MKTQQQREPPDLRPCSPITDAVYPPEIIDREFAEQGRNFGWGTLHDMRECSRKLELENAAMRLAIAEFCKAHAWACDEWKRQSHVAPLFKLANAESEGLRKPFFLACSPHQVER